MIEEATPDVSGFTTFCDDIRFEVDGKVTMVGCYHGEMTINGGFPSTLAKFAMSIIFTQKRELFEPVLKLHVFLPGDPENEPGIVVDVDSQIDITKTDRPRIGARANLVLSPLTINAPGVIKVRIARQGRYHNVGSLIVAESSSTEPPPRS
ncbi:hypothetical protein LJR220_001886 [Bradyrhizobium sp. LjRoot220]|uniref:hypothetical protein n=1 Tax=Bradyrhizobium sp. LjRoot220 TaxID=3342284 RepID=UPI003ED11DCB